MDIDVLRIGKVSSGKLDAFSSVQRDVIFSPSKAGPYSCNFMISFTDENVKPIIVCARGSAIDLPMWVERDLVDLKVCMFDRLYQDAIIVSNRLVYVFRS